MMSESEGSHLRGLEKSLSSSPRYKAGLEVTASRCACVKGGSDILRLAGLRKLDLYNILG